MNLDFILISIKLPAKPNQVWRDYLVQKSESLQHFKTRVLVDITSSDCIAYKGKIRDLCLTFDQEGQRVVDRVPTSDRTLFLSLLLVQHRRFGKSWQPTHIPLPSLQDCHFCRRPPIKFESVAVLSGRETFQICENCCKKSALIENKSQEKRYYKSMPQNKITFTCSYCYAVNAALIVDDDIEMARGICPLKCRNKSL